MRTSASLRPAAFILSLVSIFVVSFVKWHVVPSELVESSFSDYASEDGKVLTQSLDDNFPPPSTWYFPGPSTSAPSTLGYPYGDAINQSPGFTIENGVATAEIGNEGQTVSTSTVPVSSLLPANSVLQPPLPVLPPAKVLTPAAREHLKRHMKWSYGGDHRGPSHWASLNGWGICASGSYQSPINLELNVQREDNLDLLRWIGPVDPYPAKLSPPILSNTFRLDGLSGTLKFRGEDFELSYALLHTPSEHRRMGRRFRGELQLFHTRPGSKEPAFAVAAFLEPGASAPHVLRPLLTAIHSYLPTRVAVNPGGVRITTPPRTPPDQGVTVEVSTALLNSDVLGYATNYANYFSYYGSETQPPCREGVTWAVLKTPLPVPEGDLWGLAEAQGPTARPTQELGARMVYDIATGVAFQTP